MSAAIDLDELGRLARAATPGPWFGAGPSFGLDEPKYINTVVAYKDGEDGPYYNIADSSLGFNEAGHADMCYIAEANPSVILGLIERISIMDALIYERDAEIECLRYKVKAAKTEATQWKANHSNEVKRARILKERIDMPLERIRAYEHVKAVEEENSTLRQDLSDARDGWESAAEEVRELAQDAERYRWLVDSGNDTYSIFVESVDKAALDKAIDDAMVIDAAIAAKDTQS